LHGIQAEILHITKLRNGYRYHMVFRNLDPAEQDLVVRSLFLWYRNQLPDAPAPSVPSPQGNPVA
jgi:hypothetical protein